MFKRWHKWRCKKNGHIWTLPGPFEHMCWTDVCMRCWEKRMLHVAGPWPHTCDEKHGEINVPKE